MRATALVILLVPAMLVVVPAAPVWADSWEDASYDLTGHADGLGDYRGRVRIDLAGGEARVRGEINYPRSEPVAFDVRVTPEGAHGEVLRFRTPAGPLAGIIGRLAGVETAAAEVERVFTFVDRSEARGEVRWVEGANSRLVGTEQLERRETMWDWIEGTLIGLARHEIDRRVHDRYGLDETFHVADYLHIGVDAGLRILRDDELDALQREGSRAFEASGRGHPVWVEAAVAGRPRVAFQSTIPIAEGLSLTTGFEAGARLEYRMVGVYRRPDGITDAGAVLEAIRQIGANVWTVPFDADQALALDPGERHTLDGEATVGVNAGLQFGARLTDLGVLSNVVEAGASVGGSVYFSIRGYFRFEVVREQGSNVRLRLTRGNVPREGAALRAFIGLYFREGLLDAPYDVAVHSAGSYLGRIFSIEFEAGIELFKQDEMAIEYVFDLSRPEARQAYEAAIRGNLAVAQSFAGEGRLERGIVDGRFTDSLIERLSKRARLRISLLETGVTSDRTTARIEVEDLDGNVSVTNRHTYERDYRGLLGRRLHVEANGVDTEHVVGRDAGHGTLSFSYTLRSRERRTSRSELDGMLHVAEELFGDEGTRAAEVVRSRRPHDDPENDDAWYLRFPGHWNEYRSVEMTVEVEMRDRAIDRLRAADEEAFWAAFVRAHAPDQRPDWDLTNPSQRRRLLFMSDEDLRNNPSASWARIALLRGEEAVRALDALRQATDRNGAANAFRELAESQKLEPEALLGVALLAGTDDTSAHIRIAGDRVNLELRR